MIKDTLILSGGGLLGVATLGALHELFQIHPQEHIRHVAGSSVGALIGALLCVLNPMQIFEFFAKYNLFDEENIDFSSFLTECGFVQYTLIKNGVSQYIKEDCTFSEYYRMTEIHLVIVGSNLTKGAAEYFDYICTPSMTIIDALCISISIPFIFPKIEHNDCIYSDGCITDNFPWNVFNVSDSRKMGINTISKCSTQIHDMFYFVHCLVSTVLMSQVPHPVHTLTLQLDFPVLKEYTIEDLHYLFRLGKTQAQQWIKKNN